MIFDDFDLKFSDFISDFSISIFKILISDLFFVKTLESEWNNTY